jgi:hypothetical protein
MRIRALAFVLPALFATPVFALCTNDATAPFKVEFIGMSAPMTAAEKADIYTRATLRVLCADGVTTDYPLHYHQIFSTGDRVGEAVVGGLFDAAGKPLHDRDGQLTSDGPDGTSLLRIEGLHVPEALGHPLAMVTQFEYRELPPNDGISADSFWSKLPATMGLTLLDQDITNGRLTAKHYQAIDASAAHGGWIHCGSTLSRWNTHLGSEEYEPDAKVCGGAAKAADSDDQTDIGSFSRYAFGDSTTANPYHYGLLPEVSVAANGSARLIKHYATGRFSREMQILAADDRTTIGGDDGKNTGLFMFVADRAQDLSAGTLYAAKIIPPSATDQRLNLQWIRLGHASDAEIQAIVDGGVRFSDLFDVAISDPNDSSYTKVVTYTGTEWLRLKSSPTFDVAKAAAFLETRRYAALQGATTEFSKMEYIAYNPTDKRFYLAISRVEAGMTDAIGALQLPRNEGGMVLEMVTAGDQQDSNGQAINSAFVGIHLASIAELVGGWLGTNRTDAEGNACVQDKICSPDNLVYAESIRTLFIGEDTERRHNNYLWAFNLDTRQLSRLLSAPAGAEVTGLSLAPNYHGHAYLMVNFQHPGNEELKNYMGTDKDAILAEINAKWNDRRKAAIGYLGTLQGALPPLK